MGDLKEQKNKELARLYRESLKRDEGKVYNKADIKLWDSLPASYKITGKAQAQTQTGTSLMKRLLIDMLIFKNNVRI